MRKKAKEVLRQVVWKLLKVNLKLLITLIVFIVEPELITKTRKKKGTKKYKKYIKIKTELEEKR